MKKQFNVEMICLECETNYSQYGQWRFEGCTNSGEAMYYVDSEVFTPAILEAILMHALQHQYMEIAVNAYVAEYTTCSGCQRLNIQCNQAREALLDMPAFKGIVYYEDF